MMCSRLTSSMGGFDEVGLRGLPVLECIRKYKSAVQCDHAD